MSDDRERGTGTFSEFKFKNRSPDQVSAKAGVVPSSDANSCGSEVKENGGAVIPAGQDGEAAIPPGTPAPTSVFVWGKSVLPGDFWHLYVLTFDAPIITLTVESLGPPSLWAEHPGTLSVSPTGEDPANPPNLQGPVTVQPHPSNPTWC